MKHKPLSMAACFARSCQQTSEPTGLWPRQPRLLRRAFPVTLAPTMGKHHNFHLIETKKYQIFIGLFYIFFAEIRKSG